MRALLDVNVLIALLDADHSLHASTIIGSIRRASTAPVS
jgi:predicted nucleic acid-binding protein